MLRPTLHPELWCLRPEVLPHVPRHGPAPGGTRLPSTPANCSSERTNASHRRRSTSGVGPGATVGQPPSLLARRGTGADLKRETGQRSKPMVLRYVDQLTTALAGAAVRWRAVRRALTAPN